jgi:TolA-binding protein
VHYWTWLIFISFIVITAFVVVNLMIAVICDAVGILRKAEKALLHGSDASDESEVEDDSQDLGQHDLRSRLQEMEEMLDEMEEAQERMAETIKYLSIALLSRR